jgi:hypothetical protein
MAQSWLGQNFQLKLGLTEWILHAVAEHAQVRHSQHHLRNDAQLEPGNPADFSA